MEEQILFKVFKIVDNKREYLLNNNKKVWKLDDLDNSKHLLKDYKIEMYLDLELCETVSINDIFN
uniref:Uncharacterized protein n=1 Tax=uncultured marine virus TaxID=186617 RepID=A0A0F7L7G4_9VIRU|nr:hypothetical protein [uncultured marine virus]